MKSWKMLQRYDIEILETLELDVRLLRIGLLWLKLNFPKSFIRKKIINDLLCNKYMDSL